MPLHQYLIGLVYLIGVFTSVAIVTVTLVRRRYGYLRGSARALATGLIGVACLVLVHTVPGVLGVLARGTVLISAVALAVASYWLPARRLAPIQEPSIRSPASDRPSVAVAATAVLVITCYFVAFFVAQGTLAVHGYDSTNFHLPTVARWIQTGSFWRVDNFVPGWAFGDYPNTGNVVQLALILPWHSDAFIRYLNLPFLAMGALAVYGLATELGAPRAAAVTFAVASVAVPTSAVISLDNAMTDSILQPMFVIGVLFLLRFSRHRRAAELPLAGIGLGLALGTKWYGAPYAILAILVWGGAEYWRGRQFRAAGRSALQVSGWALIVGGFWLLRNLVLSGNPIFPQKVAPFGITLFDAPPDRILQQFGFTIAHYLGDPHVLIHTVFPNFKWAFGATGGLCAAGVAMSLALAWRLRQRFPAEAGRVMAVAIGTVLLVCVYFLTPYSAQGPRGNPYLMGAATRYAVPAVMVAAALTAWVSGRLGRFSPLLQLLAFVSILDSIRRYRFFGNNGFRPVAATDVLIALCALIVLAALVAVVVMLLRSRDRRIALPATAGTCVSVLTLVFLGGWFHQRAFYKARYRHYDPTFDWLITHAPSGHTVGLAGGANGGYDSPPYVMFGPRFGNVVTFVGPKYRGLLEEYHQSEPFSAALRRGRYDLLLVGGHGGPTGTPPEINWARRVGFTTVERSTRYTLMARPNP